MRSIINDCYNKTKKIIIENKELLSLIANALLEDEIITKEEIDYLVEHKHLPKEDKNGKIVEEDSKKEKTEEKPKKERKAKKEDTK